VGRSILSFIVKDDVAGKGWVLQVVHIAPVNVRAVGYAAVVVVVCAGLSCVVCCVVEWLQVL